MNIHSFIILALTSIGVSAQQALPEWKPLFNGKDLTGWTDVNTSPETWSVKDGTIICHGKKLGVMRTNKQYENFILHIEWKHMEAGGNSGTFVWANGTVAPGKPFPKAVEVQMLELDWPKLNPDKNGKPRTDDYVHGEMWGIFGLKTIPDNPRGNRSSSIEKRCKPRGQWNVYQVVCIDGVIKLSVNGKFVNGISGATQKKATSAWNPKAQRFTSATSKSWSFLQESPHQSRPLPW